VRGGVLESSALLVELGLVLRKHVLLVFTDDSSGSLLDMLRGKNLLVRNGLDTVLQDVSD
jgi:hypothetical protein